MANPLDDPRIARGMATQFDLRSRRLAAGEQPLGWKVGLGAPAALENLKLDGPLVGFLNGLTRLQPGAAVTIDDWVKPVAEPEIAVYLGQDVAAGASDETVAGAISAIGPAIELADIDVPLDDVEAILAGDIFHRHVLLGVADTTRAGARVDGLRCQVMRNGSRFADTTEIEALTGPLAAVVRRVADTLAAMGETLRDGQVIIAGSIIPPIFLERDDRQLSYTLEPIGSVSVSFGG